MFKPISFFIGKRYTRARRNNRFVSFISLMSIWGLTLGVAVLITVTSVMNGFDRELKTRILGMVPQASIASNTILPEWHQLVETVKKDPEVIAAAPYIQIQSMLTANGQVSGAVVTGVDPRLEQQVSIIGQHMRMGDLNGLTEGSFHIVLGQTLADNLGLTLGDKVTLVLPEATASAAGVIPRFKRFTITGLFSVGADVDGMMAYIALNDAAKLLQLPNGAQGVRLKLDNLFNAPLVASRLLDDLPTNYYTVDWTQTHGNLFSAIQLEKAMVGLLLFLIVLVAAFNIVSSLVMVVTDKKADIAILRTLGASPATITRIFMVQGLLIGWTGTIIGSILGVILSFNVGKWIGFLNDRLQLNLFDAYFVHYLPTEVRWSNVAVIVGASLLLSFLATIYPARRAAQVQPAEALRYE